MPLQELTRIFTILNKDKFQYYHWKSTAFLSRSFKSDADFDLLIATSEAERFQLCMKKLGVKSRCSTANKIYPGMEDYLGFDTASGKMFHLHVHFKLVIGKKNQKNYHLPFEDMVLNSSIYDNKYSIKIIQPELELMLLIIRSILKVDFKIKMARDLILGKGIFPSKIHKEFAFIIERINRDIFSGYIKDLFPELSDIFQKIVRSGDLSHLSLFQVSRLKKRVTTSLRTFRLFSNRELKRELKIKRLSHKNARSWLPTGGVSFAFVGADSSGKSSTVDHIKKWLGWKLSVQSLYIKLPKHNVLWKCIVYLTKIFNGLRLRDIKEQLNSFRWVLAAKIRFRNYGYSEMLKSQGKIVIFDRFPLKEFWNMDEPMDGPRVGDSSRWKNLERKVYNEIGYPDHIFILKVNRKASVEQKEKHSNGIKQQQIKKKIKAINELIQTKNGRYITIDTSKGQEQTLLEIKRKIWGLL